MKKLIRSRVQDSKKKLYVQVQGVEDTEEINTLVREIKRLVRRASRGNEGERVSFRVEII